ncbi:hypothetical protein OROHE_002933 [Orobanche hederae]
MDMFCPGRMVNADLARIINSDKVQLLGGWLYWLRRRGLTVKAKQKKLEKKRKPIKKRSIESRELMPEEMEKKKKEEKAREKELKKLEAAQKAAAANLQKRKKKSAKGEAREENPHDYVDPETPPGEKKKLAR